MRTLAPADALVYLETNDLAGALQPIIDSKPFNEVAKYKPDFSALKGVQLAVAVTGFETSEEQINEEQFIGQIQPHFVAIADTHAWNFQAVGFAEKKLGSFVEKIYGQSPTLEKADKHGGKYFTWTAADGRKAYALVIDSVIYFGNDETSIEKCLAVKRGEADSIAKTAKVLPADQKTLASGYVSTDGIAQIANIVGLQFASESSEDSEVQSAIAGILPQILRNSITEISWTATKTEYGIEDNYLISVQPDIANVLNLALAPVGQIFLEHTGLLGSLPADVSSVTLYSFRNPLLAWQTVISTGQKQVDPISANIIGEFANLVFEPYGIRDPKEFLDRFDDYIVTARFDDAGEKIVLLASISPLVYRIRKPFTEILETNIKKIDEGGHEVYVSEDGDLKATIGDGLILGDSESVSKCLLAQESQNSFSGLIKGRFARFDKDYPSILTFDNDSDSARQIARVITTEKRENLQTNSTSVTQTKFNSIGIERRTVSDHGLIGSIIAQVNTE